MATKPASRKRCPECRRRRIGAFRYCRSCGFDFEGSAVHRPVAAVLTLAARVPSPAESRSAFAWPDPTADGPPDAERAWLTFAPLSPQPSGDLPDRRASLTRRSPNVEPPVTARPVRALRERLSTAWEECESVHRPSGGWLVVMLVLVAAVAAGVALFVGELF